MTGHNDHHDHDHGLEPDSPCDSTTLDERAEEELPPVQGDGTVLARLNDPPESTDDSGSDAHAELPDGDGTALARLNDSSR
jgi:hypothetical protein